MDQDQDVEPPGLGRQRFLERGQRQPVDADRGPVRQRAQARCGARLGSPVGVRKLAEQLQQPDRAAGGPQPVNDPLVIKIAAGDLFDRAGHDEGDGTGHGKARKGGPVQSGPSKPAQATGDSRSTTCSESSAPAVPGPSAPAATRAFRRSCSTPARNSVVVFLPANSGSSSRLVKASGASTSFKSSSARPMSQTMPSSSSWRRRNVASTP